ncbi:MAG: RdgB/HAM1 family non-canonical purine NTP pyrophosphatase, partial [Eudoraea sp.]|uniref:RdgB/HAM1 family non-canonical purine NTP pyrophosphatase n=1 Tax=Eudoraea sp. TaxID=1979955 RepID=UPI003C74D030
CHDNIAETADNLEGNAQIKADFVTNKYNLPCFADDTGLIIDALNGAPGVYSARYSGPKGDSEENINKVLREMNNKSNRSARFITVVALNTTNTTHFFKGIVEGHISMERMGDKGFGYDPIFIPKGYDISFAQMSLEEKNKISHRAQALHLLIDYLTKTL